MTSKKRVGQKSRAPAAGRAAPSRGPAAEAAPELAGSTAPESADPDDVAPDFLPYEAFAAVYDDYMGHVPYGAWARYLEDSCERLLGARPGAVVDLACGTGQLLAHFARRLRKTGLDRSEAMLARARQRVPEARLVQGRLEGRLPFRDQSCAWLVCTHDCLNYLTDEAQLQHHFREVARILRPGGLYQVDFVSLNNILRNFDGRTIRNRFRQWKLVWTNEYDPARREMLSVLEFSQRDGQRRVERHLQRFYALTEIEALARRAGLGLALCEGDYEHRPVRTADNLWNFHFRRPMADSQRPGPGSEPTGAR